MKLDSNILSTMLGFALGKVALASTLLSSTWTLMGRPKPIPMNTYSLYPGILEQYMSLILRSDIAGVGTSALE